MGEFSLGDMSKVGEVPPVGTYRMRIAKPGHILENSNKDGHNLVLDLLLVDAPDGAEDFENFSLRVWLSLKQASRIFLKKQLEAITQAPWDQEDMGFIVDDDDETLVTSPEFEDMTFIAYCEHGTFEGAPTLQVKKYYPDDGEYEIGVAGNREEDPDDPI